MRYFCIFIAVLSFLLQAQRFSAFQTAVSAVHCVDSGDRRSCGGSASLGRYFASCFGGCEDALLRELRDPRIAASNVRRMRGGCEFQGNAETALRTVMWYDRKGVVIVRCGGM